MPLLRIKPGDSIVLGQTGQLIYNNRTNGKYSLTLKTATKPGVNSDQEVEVNLRKNGGSLEVNVVAPIEIPVHRYKVLRAIETENESPALDFDGWYEKKILVEAPFHPLLLNLPKEIF